MNSERVKSEVGLQAPRENHELPPRDGAALEVCGRPAMNRMHMKARKSQSADAQPIDPRLFQRAVAVLESPELAQAWFSRPLAIFAGKSPAEMAMTAAGARAVTQALGRLEHGVFN